MDGVSFPEVVGRYAIYDKIAAGGMASVHFGRLLGGAGFSRTVAIKRLHPHLAEDPAFRATMIDEARLAARIHHPNVVATLDVVASDGNLLLIMEYVRGESLSRLMKIESERDGRVPLPIVSAIAIGALHGLHAAHEARSDRGAPLDIVHRDVSPQNIIVGVDGMARVIDFGVAKAAGRLQTTEDGVIKGKMAYMAPEQLSARAVTRAADVYAMGVVLWEMLAGKRLFVGESNVAVFGSVLSGAKDPPSRHAPNVPATLDTLVMRALSRDAVDRFATALDMAEMLTRLVPPALPTEVGRWCDEAARESLSNRETVLADIESSSGMEMAGPLALGEVARAPQRTAGARATHDYIGVTHDLTDDAPTTASQPSSLSMATPSAGAVRARSSQRMRLVGVLSGAMVLMMGIVIVVWRGARAPAASDSLDVTPFVAAAASPPPPPQVSAATPGAEVPALPMAPPPAASASQKAPSPPATAMQRTSPPFAPAPHVVPPEGTKPKVDCNPPYQFDAQGRKTWKRECL